MVKLIIHALKRYAWFRRINAKITYSILAKHIPAEDWQFMNYGYVPNTGEKSFEGYDAQSAQKYPLQMYHYLANKTTITGKDVLEIGSGRGGGARHIAETFKPASYIGVDIAQSAVDLANKLHTLDNLKFKQGSAEAIPMEDNSVDVVINVESCHAYGSVDTFLKEVKRVLKRGGHFLMVDFRNELNVENMSTLKTQLRNSGLEIIKEEDITPNVIKSIEEEDPTKRARIAALVPARWQSLFCEFAGVVGSKFHSTLKEGSRSYYRFELRKN
jgi:ubiquinone/menaquinone biosynthesis C-methylase UbiE